MKGINPGKYDKIGDLYSTSLAPSDATSSGFKKIKSTSVCMDLESNAEFEVERYFYFSKEKNQYAGGSNAKEMEPCSR